MKLHADCIREILLYTEEHLGYGERLEPASYQSLKFDDDDIVYSLEKLLEAGYLSGTIDNYNHMKYPSIFITSITWKGHEFIDAVRSDGIWNHTKEVSKKIGSRSIDTVFRIAERIIAEIIKAQAGLI